MHLSYLILAFVSLTSMDMGSKSCAQPVCLILIMSENQQGHGKQELCPASLFNFDYEREPAGTWEARVVPR
jgi:hypothetical protein